MEESAAHSDEIILLKDQLEEKEKYILKLQTALKELRESAHQASEEFAIPISELLKEGLSKSKEENTTTNQNGEENDTKNTSTKVSTGPPKSGKSPTSRDAKSPTKVASAPTKDTKSSQKISPVSNGATKPPTGKAVEKKLSGSSKATATKSASPSVKATKTNGAK